MAQPAIANIADHSQAIIDHSQIDVTGFFTSLFTRQQFFSHLADRSFNTPWGWFELAICAALMGISFWLSRKWMPARAATTITNSKLFIRHIIQRITWPILLLVFAIIGIYVWQLTGHRTVWLQLLAMAARWMILIRLCLAILHGAVPNGRFTETLERTLAATLWVIFVFWLSGMDDNIIKVLKSLKIPLGSTSLNMWTVITAVITVCMVVVGALWLSQMINNQIMQASKLDLNLRFVLSKIVKSLLVTIAVLLALPMVGIDLTVLSVFGGALGVGLGFGLQKIASTYVSGFIILADRSIRLGDRLTINNFTGYVTKITSRFVVLRNANGAEALVPNDNFISSTVVNESYTSKALWTSVDIQVAYDTALPQALAILQQAAAKQERVSADPPPSSFVVAFADSGINLRVGYWVTDPENGFLALNSAIFLEIWNRFKEAGIDLPFPQREVRILNTDNDPIRADLHSLPNTPSAEPLNEQQKMTVDTQTSHDEPKT